ncbi:MAG TPA: transglycosylase SLT domain-containing protein [Acidimicrobiia bacterium]|nr:transglycosylase SLT domain-containing protein [Acidimicrobiia bacterium]
MRALRPLVAIPLVLLGLTAAVGHPVRAGAQTLEESEEEARAAERRAEAASGLVDGAVARRADIEAKLATSISRISDLSAELSSVSSSLDTLASQIAHGDAELSGIQADIEVHAVDAYMTALAGPGMNFVNSDNVEQALVTGQVVGDVVTSGAARVNELVARREALERLREDFEVQEQRVAALKAEVDAEVEHLAALYDEADAAVGQAVREANAADAAHRDALSAVDAAQAREAERRRQEERGTTTTNPPPPADDGGETTATTATTTPPAPTTTVADGGGGGTSDFPPAVERWRSLAAAYFPGGRVDEALAIIDCESLGDPDAYNPYSGASGLFQFLPATWASTSPQAGFSGASPFDPEANVGTAAWLANRYAELGQGYWSPWSCRRVLG